MKKKNLSLLASLLTLLPLTACGGTKASASSKPAEPSDSPISESTKTPEGEKASLTGLYTSPCRMTYQNMRPTYNYYLTTFEGEEIELFSDNTYQLTHYSSTFSALILPAEGNAATGNERTNYVETYFGTYSTKDNELDESSLDLTLEVPNRLVLSYDSTYFVDTARYDESMREATQVKDQKGQVQADYPTAADYLAAKAFSRKEGILLSKENHSFDFFDLRKPDEASPVVHPTTDAKGLKGAYLSPAKLTYHNARPGYNYYITLFTQRQVFLYDDGTYCFATYSSEYSALVLPEEGNDATGNERVNYVQKFYGKDSEKVNELDEGAVDLTLNAPSRVALGFDALYAVDSDHWDEEAKTNTAKTEYDASGKPVKTPYETAEAYLEATGFSSMEILLTKETSSFDFTEKPEIFLQ